MAPNLIYYHFFSLNGIIIIYFLMKIIHILWFNSVIIRVHWCKNIKKIHLLWPIFVHFGPIWGPVYPINGTKFDLISFCHLNNIIVLSSLIKIFHYQWLNSIHWSKNIRNTYILDSFCLFWQNLGAHIPLKWH